MERWVDKRRTEMMAHAPGCTATADRCRPNEHGIENKTIPDFGGYQAPL